MCYDSHRKELYFIDKNFSLNKSSVVTAKIIDSIPMKKEEVLDFCHFSELGVILL